MKRSEGEWRGSKERGDNGSKKSENEKERERERDEANGKVSQERKREKKRRYTELLCMKKATREMERER